jgi:hypothetical protein
MRRTKSQVEKDNNKQRYMFIRPKEKKTSFKSHSPDPCLGFGFVLF